MQGLPNCPCQHRVVYSIRQRTQWTQWTQYVLESADAQAYLASIEIHGLLAVNARASTLSKAQLVLHWLVLRTRMYFVGLYYGLACTSVPSAKPWSVAWLIDDTHVLRWLVLRTNLTGARSLFTHELQASC
jgi:hypothetical protein